MNLEKEAREYLAGYGYTGKQVSKVHNLPKLLQDFTKQTAPKLRYNEKGEVVDVPLSFDELRDSFHLGKQGYEGCDLADIKRYEQAKTPEQLFSEIAELKAWKEKTTEQYFRLNRKNKTDCKTIFKQNDEIKQLKEENKEIRTAMDLYDKEELFDQLQAKDKELKELMEGVESIYKGDSYYETVYDIEEALKKLIDSNK